MSIAAFRLKLVATLAWTTGCGTIKRGEAREQRVHEHEGDHFPGDDHRRRADGVWGRVHDPGPALLAGHGHRAASLRSGDERIVRQPRSPGAASRLSSLEKTLQLFAALSSVVGGGNGASARECGTAPKRNQVIGRQGKISVCVAGRLVPPEPTNKRKNQYDHNPQWKGFL